MAIRDSQEYELVVKQNPPGNVRDSQDYELILMPFVPPGAGLDKYQPNVTVNT